VNWKAALAAANQNEALAIELLVSTGFDPATNTVGCGSILGAGNSEEIAQAWASCGASMTKLQLVEMLDNLFTDAMRHAVPVGDIVNVAQTLHGNGYILGVASSDSQGAVHTFLDGMKLSPLFSFAAGYNSGYGHKPEPGMLNGFCQHQGLDPSQVAMVGDNPQDMEMGRQAGAGLCVAVLSGNGKTEDLNALADFTIKDVSELHCLLGVAPRVDSRFP
jgi:phosphoglycolate phosphatase